MATTPFKVTDFRTNQKLIYDFLLVINTNLLVSDIAIFVLKRDVKLQLTNTNLPPMLHRFRDIAFDRSKIAIFDYSCCV